MQHRTSLLRSRRVFAALILLALPMSSLAQRLKLQFVSPLRMVDCQPVSSIPCFRSAFNVLDANGAPAPLPMHGDGSLVSHISVDAGGLPAKVFYATTNQSSKPMPRITLILIDVSGSMNAVLPSGETRFQAARAALTQFVENFEDGVDQVAIVPFGSHEVVDTIQSATFAQTKQAALEQIDRLPTPLKTNNTALFTAVSVGLDTLTKHLAVVERDKVMPSGLQTLVVVMTDGKNETSPQDDPGLLTGTTGLSQAAAAVSASSFPVIGIGFGSANEIDQDALRHLSNQPVLLAESAGSLKQAFRFERQSMFDRVEISFLSPWQDRASLAGKSMGVIATLALPDGSQLTSNESIFETPQIGIPLFSGKASLAELAALNAATTAVPASEWVTWLRPFFVFLGLGTLFLVAWFWIPRLIWPGQYLGNMSTPRTSRKWAYRTPTQTQQRSAASPTSTGPIGFVNVKGRAALRNPDDATMVLPAVDVTRTRLEADWK